MLKKIVYINLLMMFVVSNISYSAQQNQPHKQQGLRFWDLRIAVLAVGIGTVLSLLDKAHKLDCCTSLGYAIIPLDNFVRLTEIDGVTYERYYRKTDSCPEVRKNACPDLKDRLYTRQISLEGNYDDLIPPCFYDISYDDIKKLEKKSVQVDTQGYLIYPNDEKK